MIWLDYVIVTILGYNIVVGIMNGFVRSLFNLGALLGAFLLAPALKPILVPIVKAILKSNEILAVPIGMGLSWVLVYLAISIAGMLVFKIIKKTPIQGVDRAMGALFGLLVSTILIFMPIIFVESIPLMQKIPVVPQTLQKSTLLPLLHPAKGLVKNQISHLLLGYWKKFEGQFPVSSPSPSPSKK